VIIPRADLARTLAAAGIPAFATLHLNGDRFATVSREWVTETWTAGIQALQANLPALVDVRALGGGKTQIVPRYVLNGFNCRGHHLFIFAHGLMGFAELAAESRVALDHDALAWGFLEYTAVPRDVNRYRNGRHAQIWFIDPAGVFQTFESGDGEEHEFTAQELSSVTFLYAQ
jgi:hypothetical protein